MKNGCKVEIKRAFRSGTMKIAILLGFLLSCWHVIDTYGQWKEYWIIRERYTSPLFSMPSLYTKLMGMNGNQIQSVLFHNLIPMFAALPFSVSYWTDQKSGYQKNIYTREKKGHYFLGKLTAVFLSGGTVVIVPVVTDFILLSTFLPASNPDSCVVNGCLAAFCNWQTIFYQEPFLYVLIYLIIYFVGGGILALVALATSKWIKKSLIAFLSPFFLCIVIQILLQEYPGFAPYSFLNMSQPQRFEIWQMVVSLCLIGCFSIGAFL